MKRDCTSKGVREILRGRLSKKMPEGTWKRISELGRQDLGKRGCDGRARGWERERAGV